MQNLLESYHDILIDLFTRVQLLQANPMGAYEECLVIQLMLIQIIMDVESEISNAKHQISESKRLLTERQTKDKAKAIKSRIDTLHHMIDEFTYVLRVFRSVGDALIFTYVERWDIKPIAFKESPGFLTGKEGLKEELRVLKEWVDKKKIVILNDLTNNMLFGDITVINDMHQFSLIEVKSGTQKFKAHKKQTNKRLKLESYLKTDKVEDLHFTGQNMLRISAHSPLEDHLQEINVLMNQALQVGYSDLLEVEKGLAYYIDTEFSDERGEKIIQALTERMGKLYIGMPRYSKPGYYPFVLSIKNPNAAFRFYNSEIVIMVFIDLDYMKEKFNSYNIKLDYIKDEVYLFNTHYCDEQDNIPINMSVSKYLFNRISNEFISLNWLIEELVHRINRNVYDALLSEHDTNT